MTVTTSISSARPAARLDSPAPRAPVGADPSKVARARSAATVLLAALGIGVAGDRLLYDAPLGAGATLFVWCVLAVTAWLAARARRLSAPARPLVAAAALFAAGFSWRASGALTLLNLLSLGIALALLAGVLVSGGRWSVRVARFRDYAAALWHCAARGLVGAPMAALDAAHWRPERALPVPVNAATVVRAALITAPLLILFTGLLTAADPVFARLLGDVFAVDLGSVPEHAAITCAIAWPVAGYLSATVLAPRLARPSKRSALPSLGVAEIATALGSLNALFLTFVVVQVRYLFGGGDGLQVAGLTYAEYARRGFFELVWVTALVLPVLLVTRELLGPTARRGERTYRALGGVMLILVLMIVASAAQRMRMYQAEYGLTELRLYTSVFMGWVVAVLGLFAITVLQGRRRGLAFGALSAGWAVVGALNVVNPDALIVRVNAARLARGQPFDAAYAAGLSADAAPALHAVLGHLSGDARCAVAHGLTRPSGTGPVTWRAWSVGRARATAIGRAPDVRRAARECEAAQQQQRLEARLRHTPVVVPPPAP